MSNNEFVQLRNGKPYCNSLGCLMRRKQIENMTMEELEKVLEKCNNCSCTSNKERVQKTRNLVWATYVQRYWTNKS